MSVEEHKQIAPQTVNCMVITVSDTRDETTDKSGKLIMELLKDGGHRIVDYRIVKDDREQIRQLIESACNDSEIDAVLLNGGTGITGRDTTYEAVESQLDKILPGFGEIFRMLSYTEDIGSAAILSRAIAGISCNTAVFSMPGSTGAVKLAMNKLILPELGHIIREMKRDLI